MAVIWNLTVRKSVAIVIPVPKAGYIAVGFGVCPHNSDPKLVKITIDKKSSMWVVEVFTLSTRVWKTVYMGAPFISCDILAFYQVFVNGVIYFGAFDVDVNRVMSNYIISYDLKSEKLGKVCLSERLVNTPDLNVTNVNESLGLLEYYYESEMLVRGVWMRKDGANEPFTKIYTVKVYGKSVFRRVLGFRNHGEAVIKLMDDDNDKEFGIEVYKPLFGPKFVGISGKGYKFSVRSYMETLLLLNESDSIIR